MSSVSPHAFCNDLRIRTVYSFIAGWGWQKKHCDPTHSVRFEGYNPALRDKSQWKQRELKPFTAD